MEKWWEVSKIKEQLAAVDLCQCKTEMRGRWLIVDPETMERAYVCVSCKRRVYPKAQ
ncbi:hypothetical protein [Ammoniphilus sp. 3BR4]|uniref:hypothetical protein n=1 Tax=Ammoniphilus sp. 3BR4 TaxID=3158265 RepID=UPI003466BE3F